MANGRRVIWGFGGVKIAIDAAFIDYVYFNHSAVKLEFEQEYNEWITASGTLRRKFKGYRPKITFTVHNIGNDLAFAVDYAEIQHFLQIINAVRTQGLAGFYVQPRNNIAEPTPEWDTYLCELTSPSLLVEDGDQTAQFQTISIEFRGINLEQALPIFASDPNEKYWCNENGDNYVDCSAVPKHYSMSN